MQDGLHIALGTLTHHGAEECDGVHHQMARPAPDLAPTAVEEGDYLGHVFTLHSFVLCPLLLGLVLVDILYDAGEEVIHTLTPAGGGDGEDDDFLRRADGALPETSRGERSDDGRVGDMVAAVELHIRARRGEGRLA